MEKKIFGRITNETNGGSPVAGLKVEAWDDDWPEGDFPLRKGGKGSDGADAKTIAAEAAPTALDKRSGSGEGSRSGFSRDGFEGDDKP